MCLPPSSLLTASPAVLRESQDWAHSIGLSIGWSWIHPNLNEHTYEDPPLHLRPHTYECTNTSIYAHTCALHVQTTHTHTHTLLQGFHVSSFSYSIKRLHDPVCLSFPPVTAAAKVHLEDPHSCHRVESVAPLFEPPCFFYTEAASQKRKWGGEPGREWCPFLRQIVHQGPCQGPELSAGQTTVVFCPARCLCATVHTESIVTSFQG